MVEDDTCADIKKYLPTIMPSQLVRMRLTPLMARARITIARISVSEGEVQ